MPRLRDGKSLVACAPRAFADPSASVTLPHSSGYDFRSAPGCGTEKSFVTWAAAARCALKVRRSLRLCHPLCSFISPGYSLIASFTSWMKCVAREEAVSSEAFFSAAFLSAYSNITSRFID